MLFIASISAVCPERIDSGDLEDARFRAEIEDRIGHRHRALVVADHELEEEAVRFLPRGRCQSVELGIRCHPHRGPCLFIAERCARFRTAVFVVAAVGRHPRHHGSARLGQSPLHEPVEHLAALTGLTRRDVVGEHPQLFVVGLAVDLHRHRRSPGRGAPACRGRSRLRRNPSSGRPGGRGAPKVEKRPIAKASPPIARHARTTTIHRRGAVAVGSSVIVATACRVRPARPSRRRSAPARSGCASRP